MASGLLDTLTLAIAIISPQLRYLYVNEELARHFGRRRPDVQGRLIREVWGEAREKRFRDATVQRALAGQSFLRTGWIEYPTGERCMVKETMSPFRGADGAVQAVVIFTRDDTQLKRREVQLAQRMKELKASEARKSAIFDNSLNAMVTSDDHGRIIEFNPAAEQMFGHRRQEVLGRRIEDVLIPERYRAAHAMGLARLRAGGESRILGNRVQLDALKRDGSEFPIEMALWRSTIGAGVFYTASIADLTERHNAIRQRDLLRQSEKLTAMGALLAGVAHELNNPLAVAMGRASLLEEKCRDADLREDARRIREATDRCGRIVRTFLALAREVPTQRAPAQLNDFVHDVLRMLQYTLRTHRIDVETDLADGLPAVLVDADQILQLVTNLLAHAQHALDGAQGMRRVVLRTGASQRSDGHALQWLRVADTGPGISGDVLPNIFDPSVTTRGDAIGSGLVLPLSRSLARAHGGDLVVEETGPSGTTMLLTLPVKQL
jgi:two-component system NtrC family sensor kinase